MILEKVLDRHDISYTVEVLVTDFCDLNEFAFIQVSNHQLLSDNIGGSGNGGRFLFQNIVGLRW